MSTVLGKTDAPLAWLKEPLAYVEWYQSFRHEPDSVTGMFIVKKGHSADFSIIPVSSIRQVCMLIPRFRDNSNWKKEWNSSNVLDNCSNFYLNNWQSNYAYQTLW